MTQDEINAVKKAAEKMRKQESAQDEIIEMARQAGFMMENSAAIQAAEIFAKLVAAKERDACAKVCEARAKDFLALYTRYQDEQDNGSEIAATQCARYIRARGEA